MIFQSIEPQPGFLKFDVCRCNTNDHEVFLYEIYSDEAAFAEHLDSAHFKEFDRELAAFVEDKWVTTLTLIGPKFQAT